MSEKPRPTWFRFGLRTLLLVMTVLCCYLGWEVNAVRQRRALMEEFRLNHAFRITTASAAGQPPLAGKPAGTASVSFLRRLLATKPFRTSPTIEPAPDSLTANSLGRRERFPKPTFTSHKKS
jgi:hypothetical protein